MAKATSKNITTRLLDLSFVASRDGKNLPKPKPGQHGRCWWNVTSTGDYNRDCEIGQRLAIEYLAFEEADKGGAGHLNLIVNDMPRPLTGVEHGFLIMVSFAAGAGANEARRIDAYWKACMQKLKDSERSA